MRPALPLLLVAFCVSSFARADEPIVVNLWPAKPPGEKADVGPEDDAKSDAQIRRITNIGTPTIAVYKPPKDKDTGAAVIIAPGGGYNILAISHEGTDVATWLNSIGVTGIVLKYRVPRRADQPKDQPPIGALQDAQRAVRLVRSRASEWGLDPKRIGLLGFSAGGHLAAWAATNPDKPSYEAIDAIDRTSAQPDFLALIYPAYLVGKDDPAKLSPEIRVSAETPPTFLAHAYDDPVTPESSLQFALALKGVKVPAELHLYAKGGHGYGMLKNGNPTESWPDRCADWLKAQGLLKK